jgi:hypothetical protein
MFRMLFRCVPDAVNALKFQLAVGTPAVVPDVPASSGKAPRHSFTDNFVINMTFTPP